MKNMQSTARALSAAALGTALILTPPKLVNAEDIDLFVSAAAVAGTNPNVLIFIDNSANWNSAAQHWDASLKQGQSELRAITTILSQLDGTNPKVNMGLMMFRSGSPDGAIVRFGIRPMNTTNIQAFKDLIGALSGCPTANNSVNGTPNCILQNFSGTGVEQTNSASTNYSGGMMDVYKYFGGFTSPTYAQADQQPPGALNDSTHHGQRRYFDPGNNLPSRADPVAYSGDGLSYVSPIASPCAKNYLIFIGNGFPSQDADILGNVNEGATPQTPAQLAVPNFTTIANTTTTTLGTDSTCETASACASAVSAANGTLYDSYACTGGSQDTPAASGTDTVCETQSICQTTRGPLLFPGHTNYVCSGGTSSSVSSTTTLANATGCFATAALCQAAQPNPNGGTTYDSFTCSGGISDGTVLSTNFSNTTCISQTTCQGTTTQGAGNAANFGNLGYSSFVCSAQSTAGCAAGTGKKWTVTGHTSPVCTSPSKTNWTVTGTINACASPSLKNQTIQAYDVSNVCAGSNFRNQTEQGTKTVNTVTPLTTFCTPGTAGCVPVNNADEWARFLYTTDVSALLGQQNVATYTIDVFKDHQDTNETGLLFNMAKYGGGKYFQATNEDAIVSALNQILIEVQSVNSVFASASLPISSTNRSQNANEIYIGMFRPDASGNPRWYGNLKKYQFAQFGNDVLPADASTPPQQLASSATGFVQPCAVSFWTQDSGSYWLFQNGSAGQCTTAGTTATFSDSPDGPLVEKGAAAEILRRGNAPPTTPGVQSPLPGPNRTIYTCATAASCCPTCATGQSTTLVTFNSTNVSKAELGSATMTDQQRDNIINFTIGQDIFDNNTNANASDVRPSIHGDVAHSRPVPVNYGASTGVVLYYGANDGSLRAVRGSDGKELWAFIAPEHHAKLQRLVDNSPPILYPNQDPVPVGATRKDYFFDGTAGLFQNVDNSKIWIFPSMRRGGRMIYGFDVTNPNTPAMKWKVGCTNAALSDSTSCTLGFEQMGQTWSTPSVALVKGFSTDPNQPVIITGGGYDDCEDQDVAPNTQCTASGRKGNAVYVINADTGALIRSFSTSGSVPADVTLIDRDFDGFVDHAYVADTLGNVYRLDFVDPATISPRSSANWTMTQIAFTTGANRKFLFSPAALPASGKVYLAFASGDRERPLITDYPYPTGSNPGVLNRAYMFIDKLTGGSPVNLDGSSMTDLSSGSACGTASPESQGQSGWFIDLSAGAANATSTAGEQAVTSTIIFGGLIFFSTNRPVAVPVGACANNLGEARGYALNLLNASGAADTLNICGGARNVVFVGGGLPPSPVTGTVPVGGKETTVMIGGAPRGGGTACAICGNKVTPTITQRRQRVYWYTDSDK
jgi:Tfp pilus tip-associated adhesin PilY1